MENEIEIFKDADYCRQVVEAMRVCVNEFGANSAKGNETSEGAYKMAMAFIKTGSYISSDLGDELKKQFKAGFEKEMEKKISEDTAFDVDER